MARIAGINIPNSQHLEVGLTSIFGIGRSRARQICNLLKISCSKKVKDLNDDELENGDVNDYKRIEYFSLHLNEIYKLLCNGYPVKSYFAWSLLDNFEWSCGYNKRFGLVYVDYKNQQRIPKASWYEFKKQLKK